MVTAAMAMQNIANTIPATTIKSIERKVTRIARARSRRIPPSPITADEAFQESMTIVLSKPSLKLIQLIRPLRKAFVAQVAHAGAAGGEALLYHLLAEGPTVTTPGIIDLPAVSVTSRRLIAFLGGMAFNLIREGSRDERRHQEIIAANDKLVLVYGQQQLARRIVRTSGASGNTQNMGDEGSRDYGASDPMLDAVIMPDRLEIVQRAAADELLRIERRYGAQAAQTFRYLCKVHFVDGLSVNAAIERLPEVGKESNMSRMSLYRAIKYVEAKIKEQLSE